MMLNSRAAALGLACLLAAIPASHLGQDSRAFLANVSKTIGADGLRTIQFSGMGSNAGVGQNTNPNNRWPLVRVRNYTQEIDFAANFSHVRLVRVQDNSDQNQDRYSSAASPWEVQSSFWLTPFGFLKGATTYESNVKSETVQGTMYNVVSFSVDNKYKVVGYINDKDLVEKVETWIGEKGDTLVEAYYRDYTDFNGLQVPTMITQKQAGTLSLILVVKDAKVGK